MPCTDCGPSFSDEREAAQRADAEKRRIKARLDSYARMLCFLCGQSEILFEALTAQGSAHYAKYRNLWGYLNSLPKTEESLNAAEEVEEWWIQHEQEDADRRKREHDARLKKEADQRLIDKQNKHKESALKKLTPDERAALGL